jgi:uncharacterized protein (TIGR02996 family)
MSDHASFLRAIIDHADEDGPRLVYADWLDERGDPRGEFIRLQCELERLTDAGRKAQIETQCHELFIRHRADWEIPGVDRQIFRRGFPEELTLPAHFTLEQMLDVFDRTPVRALVVSGRNFGFSLWGLVSRPVVRFCGGSTSGRSSSATTGRAPWPARRT